MVKISKPNALSSSVSVFSSSVASSAFPRRRSTKGEKTAKEREASEARRRVEEQAKELEARWASTKSPAEAQPASASAGAAEEPERSASKEVVVESAVARDDDRPAAPKEEEATEKVENVEDEGAREEAPAVPAAESGLSERTERSATSARSAKSAMSARSARSIESIKSVWSAKSARGIQGDEDDGSIKSEWSVHHSVRPSPTDRTERASAVVEEAEDAMSLLMKMSASMIERELEMDRMDVAREERVKELNKKLGIAEEPVDERTKNNDPSEDSVAISERTSGSFREEVEAVEEEPVAEEGVEEPAVEEDAEEPAEAEPYQAEFAPPPALYQAFSGSTLDRTVDSAADRTADRTTATARTTKTAHVHRDVAYVEEGMTVRTLPTVPKPKEDGHVVVKVEASTITPRDHQMCEGNGLTKEMLPFVPGYEFVGHVHDLSAKAEDWGYQKGDRVAGMSLAGGGNGMYVSVPAQRLTLVPESVKATHAACLVHDYAAAYRAIRTAKALAGREHYPFTGKRLLVTDPHSPVGLAVIDLASSEGFLIYAAAERGKKSFLEGLGVTCLDKDPYVWLPEHHDTMDIVIDNDLSCTDFYDGPSYALNETGGLVCLVTANDESRLSGKSWDGFLRNLASVKAGSLMQRTAFVDAETCWNLSGKWDYPKDNLTKSYRKDLQYLMRQLELGRIKPLVAAKVSLDDVPKAQKLVRSGKACGTLICVP
ncbi:hypothetical protein ACHAWF_011991 [Thalassiosira exigua]